MEVKIEKTIEFLKLMVDSEAGLYEKVFISYREINYMFENRYAKNTFEFSLEKCEEYESNDEIIEVYRFSLIDDEDVLFSFKLDYDDEFYEANVEIKNDIVFINIKDIKTDFMVNPAFLAIGFPSR